MAEGAADYVTLLRLWAKCLIRHRGELRHAHCIAQIQTDRQTDWQTKKQIELRNWIQADKRKASPTDRNVKEKFDAGYWFPYNCTKSTRRKNVLLLSWRWVYSTIYAKKKKLHLLTKNVQITAYKQLHTWYESYRHTVWPLWASITAAILLGIDLQGNSGDVSLRKVRPYESFFQSHYDFQKVHLAFIWS